MGVGVARVDVAVVCELQPRAHGLVRVVSGTRIRSVKGTSQLKKRQYSVYSCYLAVPSPTRGARERRLVSS